MKTAILWYTGSWSTEVEVADDFDPTPEAVKELVEGRGDVFTFQEGWVVEVDGWVFDFQEGWVFKADGRVFKVDSSVIDSSGD